MAAAEAERLRVEEQLVGLTAEADAVPAIPHPRIAEAYRRQVEALEGLLAEGSMEALEAALTDPSTAMAATEALRALIDAILVFPGERRGEVSVSLRGDLAAFLHAAEAS
jgi:hypothetical protein